MPRQTVWCLWYGRWKSTVLVFCVYLLVGGILYPTSAIAGGRIIKEDSDNDGQTDRIVHLAPSGDVVKLDADTNGDGRMDTVYQYEAGKPRLVTRDTTGDGRVNVWQRFRNEKPYEQTADLNSDGQIDQIIRFDEQGRPAESRHDLDEDGRLETIRYYKNGELCRQESFINSRTMPDIVTEFAEGQAVSEQRDTNGDGAFDVLVKMSKGKPISKEEDTNHDGRMDRLTTYDDRGRPLCLMEFDTKGKEPVKTSWFKEGELYGVKQIDNGRVVFTRFQNDKPVKQTIDEDGDGRPEQTITFDQNGLIEKETIDTNRDGRIDAWMHYVKGVLYSSEQDRDYDGKVDARFWYDEGKLSRSLLDENGDGYFETRVRCDSPKWTKIMELLDKKGRLIERSYYLREKIRKRDFFAPHTSRVVKVEEFNEEGKIVLSREAESGSSFLDLTWHYDADENPVMAEKDTDGDGKTDVWYYYKNGRITKIKEDRNRDGKPDLWEDYDSGQVVVRRSEDLDFDGTADIERRF